MTILITVVVVVEEVEVEVEVVERRPNGQKILSGLEWPGRELPNLRIYSRVLGFRGFRGLRG